MSKKKKRSLRGIVFLIVGITVIMFIAIFFGIFHSTMPQMLLDSEQKYLVEQLDIVEGLLSSAMHSTYLMSADLSIWDETVSFALGENPDYLSDNWPDSSMLETYQYNFVVMKDAYQNSIYVEFYDYATDRELAVPAGFTDYLSDTARDVMHMYDNGNPSTDAIESYGKGGIIFYDDVPYFIATMPIMDSRGSDDPVGTVTLGSMLTNEYFHQMTNFGTMTFDVVQTDAQGHLPWAVINRDNDEFVSTTLPLRDMDHNPVVLVMTDVRTIYTEGTQVIQLTTILLSIAAGVFTFALYLVIVNMAIKPVERLSKDVQAVGEQGDIDTTSYSKNKEFYMLSTSINDMVDGLNESRISLTAFQSILNSLDAYVYVSKPDSDEIIFMNDNLREHFHIEGDPLGKTCWQLMHAENEERCEKCPADALKEQPDAVITWEEKSEVTGRYYRNTDRLIEWADGTKAHLHYRIDITEIREAEASLQKRLEQQELMSAMSQNFISTDEMSVLIGRALEMTGNFFDAGKIVIAGLSADKTMLEYKYGWHNSSDDTKMLEVTAFPFNPGHVLYDEYITNHATYIACDDVQGKPQFDYLAKFGVKSFLSVPIYVGGTFWGIMNVDNSGNGRKWDEGDIHLLRLISSVISGVIARSETEEELIRLSSIVNSSPQYISYVNSNGDFEYLNPGAAEITGYSEKELMKTGMQVLFDKQTMQRIRQDLIPRILNGEKQVIELPIRRKEGVERILLFYIFRAGHKKVGIGAIASDITEKRQLEQQYIKAKEQAEQSSRAKSDFLSRMSHEMRTPMNAIIGMTSIAKTSEDIDKKDYCLNKIDDASTHLLGVINDILDMSKIEANKFELSYSDFSFEKMLMKVTNVVNFRIDEKKQNFVVHVDKNMPHSIISDEQRLSQVLTNLLSNAVKFTPDLGTITLSAKMLDEQDGMCTLQMEVKDTGIGISDEQQKKLFRSFEQADGGISRRFGGTGLGLAISKTIVEMMDGKIWVESRPDEGSTFIFTIKARRGDENKQNLLTPDVGWKDLRVLAVDDSSDVRDYFLSIADSLGFKCEVADGGLQACEMIDKNKDDIYNIIFVDWRMPDMNGIELTKRIKELYGENTIVIMISATEWSNIEIEATNAGVDKYIPKPLFPSVIADCINECIGVMNDGMQAELGMDAFDGRFEGRRILLAEDIEINREIVLALLEPTGVAIDTAENGLIAYEMFADHPDVYDMIFMDIHMPEMDGYETTKKIRRLGTKRAKEIPIVAMTANVFKEDVEKSLRAGMNDHVGKPLDIVEVIHMMERYMPDDPAGEK